MPMSYLFHAVTPLRELIEYLFPCRLKILAPYGFTNLPSYIFT